jgi:hypothetical protein
MIPTTYHCTDANHVITITLDQQTLLRLFKSQQLLLSEVRPKDNLHKACLQKLALQAVRN